MHSFRVKIVPLDVKVLCSVAKDIANCTQQHLGDCFAAQVYYSHYYQLIDDSFRSVDQYWLKSRIWLTIVVHTEMI